MLIAVLSDRDLRALYDTAYLSALNVEVRIISSLLGLPLRLVKLSPCLVFAPRSEG